MIYYFLFPKERKFNNNLQKGLVMKKILFICSLVFYPVTVLANGCPLLGKIKPIGTQILIKDAKGRNHEMLCAEVAQLYMVNGKVRIKKTSPKWVKKITNALGEDCW